MCLQGITDFFSGSGKAAPSDYGVGAGADYLMGTPTAEAYQSMPSFGDYGGGASADYLMGTPTPGAYTPTYSGGGGGAPSAGGGAPAAGGGGIGNTLKGAFDIAKPFLPIAASALLSGQGAKAQQNMYENLAGAQQQSYQQYLQNLNPPEQVKQAQYQKAVNQILPTANLNSRKIYNELASRGVRGGGLASPTAGMERDVTKAKQNAYLDIYGRYNVPQVPPPVAYTPGTSNIIGSNAGDIGTTLLLKQLFG